MSRVSTTHRYNWLLFIILVIRSSLNTVTVSGIRITNSSEKRRDKRDVQNSVDIPGVNVNHVRNINNWILQSVRQSNSQSKSNTSNERNRQTLDANTPKSNNDGDCPSICSRLNVPILSDLEVEPSLTCGDLDAFLSLYCEHPYMSHSVMNDYERVCCDMSAFPNTYQCSSNIRSLILNGEDDYDTAVAPIPAGNQKLTLYVVFSFRAATVNIQDSGLDLFASVSLLWYDQRLEWPVDNTTYCASSVQARASTDPEQTEIYVPTFDLLNREAGFNQFEPNMATVYHDGLVLLERNGLLQAFCSFRGLRKIPYGKLGCRLHFALQSENKDINIQLLDFSPVVGTKYAPAPGIYAPYYIQTFSEYEIDHQSTQAFQKPYNEIAVDIYLMRSITYYLFLLIIPTSIFTYIALGQTLLPIGNDRLSFGLNCIFIIVAQSIVTSQYIPNCREMLWLNMFVFVSFIFTLLCFVEGVLAGFLLNIDQRIVRDHDNTNDVNTTSNNNNNKNNNKHNNTNDDDDDKQSQGDVSYDFSLSPDTQQSNNNNNSNHHESPTNSKHKWYRKHCYDLPSVVKKLDRLSLFFFPIGYTVFLAVFIATAPNFGGDDYTWA